MTVSELIELRSAQPADYEVAVRTHPPWQLLNMARCHNWTRPGLRAQMMAPQGA